MSHNINALNTMSNSNNSSVNSLSNNSYQNSSETNYETNYNLLLAKKTEKIVTAIYLISQFLSDRESLKFSLRDRATALLSIMNQIANQDFDSPHITFSDLKNTSHNIFVLYQEILLVVKEIISLLSVTRDARLISEMNTNLVIDNLKKLEEILSRQQFVFNPDLMKIGEENIYENIYFKRDFKFKPIQDKVANLKNSSTRHAESIRQMSYRNTGLSVNKVNNQDNKINKSVEDKTNNKSNKSVLIQDRKSNRRDQILALMLKNQEYSISDITSKIPGCSDKTVARELDNLISEKKLQRIGERRWARYSLN